MLRVYRIVDSIFYWLVAASVAELASAMPSSGTGKLLLPFHFSVFLRDFADVEIVYHWASVTAGRHGRICGWFAGWWNLAAWVFGAASLGSFMALQTLAMYSIIHPGFNMQGWHIFISYLLSTWLCCLIVLYGNRALPMIGNLGGIFSSVGFLISIVVCVVMPHVKGTPYASNTFVWTKMENTTGWSSSAFVFCLGMLNGAFAVGAPDISSHLAEEIPRYCYPRSCITLRSPNAMCMSC